MEAGGGGGEQQGRWEEQGPPVRRSSGLGGSPTVQAWLARSLSQLSHLIISPTSLNLSCPASVSYSVQGVEDLSSLHVMRI